MAEHVTTTTLNASAARIFDVLARIDAYASRFDQCTMSRIDAWSGSDEARRDTGGDTGAGTGAATLRVEVPKYRVAEEIEVRFAVRPERLEIDTASCAASMPGQELRLAYRVEPVGPERCVLHVRLSYERLGFRLFALAFANVRERMVGTLGRMVERAARTVPADETGLSAADPFGAANGNAPASDAGPVHQVRSIA